MDTKQLKTFRSIARNLSFSKTAAELNFAQSTVSAQIRSLENELRLTLFDRLGKKVVLTEAGKSVLQYANRFMAIEEEFIASLKTTTEIGGELNIYAPNTICVYHLPQLLSRFREQHPRVNFKLRAHLGSTRALTELRAGNVDLVMIMEEAFSEPDFNITALREEDIIFICHNSHSLADRSALWLNDLKEQNFILTEPSCGYRAVIAHEFLKLGCKLEPVMWFDNAEAIKECVKNNMGISFLPKIAAEADIAAGKFKQLNVQQGFDKRIKLQLVTHKDKWLSPALQEFVAALKDSFSPKGL
jgi:DNA-binding transcriptional LysR family regulator